MPTKKRRIGFIPRIEVFNLVNKLSQQSNLSNSKIINILVEEALIKRGMLNLYDENVHKKKFINKLENVFNEEKADTLDMKIYAKFLMFLQFQERIKKESIKD